MTRKTSEQQIASMLEGEAADVESRRGQGGTGGPLHPTRPPQDPSQVYALRMPVERLEQLRELAAREGKTPSALMRQWVLERLDLEASDGAVDERVRRAVRLELERVGLGRKAG